MENSKNVKIIMKSILTGYLITLILIFAYAAILAYTKIPESTIPTCLFLIGMVSVFLSSSFAVIKIKKNGLKNGGIIGLGYVLILYILSSIFESNFMFNTYSILTIIFYVLLGMFGGIIGVNFALKK